MRRFTTSFWKHEWVVKSHLSHLSHMLKNFQPASKDINWLSASANLPQSKKLSQLKSMKTMKSMNVWF